jgi:hypothetical protein
VTIRIAVISKPGPTPARKSVPTDKPVIEP